MRLQTRAELALNVKFVLNQRFTNDANYQQAYYFSQRLMQTDRFCSTSGQTLLTTVFLRFFLKNFKKRIFKDKLQLRAKPLTPTAKIVLHLLQQTAVILSPWKLFKLNARRAKYSFSSKFYFVRRNIRIQQLTWHFLKTRALSSINLKGVAKLSQNVYKILSKDRLRLQKSAANPRLRGKDFNKQGALIFLALSLSTHSSPKYAMDNKSKFLEFYAAAIGALAHSCSMFFKM